MLEKISTLIQSFADFLGGFSKLNDVKDHSVTVFFKIILCSLGALFFCKLFLRDDLYDWVVTIALKPNPISIAIVVGLGMLVYSVYAQKRIMAAVSSALQQQKWQDKLKDKECYAQTSRIEEEANALTDHLRKALNCDVVTIELMHNTEKYIGGYHKRFYDESFPSINTAEGITFNYKDFQCIPTNIFPIIGQILKTKFKWFTSMDEVAEIDSGYAHILKETNCIALGMRAMKTSNNEDLGILTVTWRQGHEDRIPDIDIIQDMMTEVASKLEVLLDMSAYE
nr:MAG TPA: hypothetical protein [Caudoviricetes sp.]